MTDPTPGGGAGDASDDGVLKALTDLIRGSATPDVQAAQALLLRRLALEGDVIPSRLPAPKNITEMGGYLNLLATLGMTDMRSEMLSAALGLAIPPAPQLEQDVLPPPLPLVPLANDLPSGPGAASVAPSIHLRSDLAPGLSKAMGTIHSWSGQLPLWSPPPVLPPALMQPPAGEEIDSLLFALGRAVRIAPAAALADPATDPVVLARRKGDPPGYGPALAVHAGTKGAVKTGWQAVHWDAATATYSKKALAGRPLLPLHTALEGSGFTPRWIPALPSGPTDLAWAELGNVTGLLAGVSRFGTELALAHAPGAIRASALASMVDRLWDGERFAS
ncbi:hypothetical protein [Actinacidiphila paucisporea]|uniref:Uncharacterized protein n=1 Tax=Actinacidiphila paucisporea TaxID=310782 RepID=A0A1M7MMC5_9ACTN|nr:hypothetical protein [Actinacidiphila paucisporea]SHM92157.1 hypothetical protein SAMN05216499_116105 [Actinacidiphila paucisporea]